jgi:hypothetical protein
MLCSEELAEMTLNPQPSTLNQLRPPLIKMDVAVKAKVEKFFGS